MPGPSGSEGPRIVAGRATSVRKRCCDVHCNSLWSVWYGLLVIIFQSFILYKCVTRFLIYVALPWPEKEQPYLELNLYVGLVGAGVVLLPFYFISFMFKIGNLANDGYKIGMELSSCAMDPPSILSRSSGVIRNAWHHGGPTSSFIHLVSAFCFVLPKIFIEGKLIQVGFLAKDKIWKTDLDWLVPHQDRLVILNFLTGGLVNASFTTTTQAPYLHPAAQIREYLDSEDSWWPMCPEFLNYILALTVYGVRYPSVFWNTNKVFSFVFSLQLFANNIQSLISIGGIAIMYKIQILGPQNVLHKYEPFLLNGPICILLYVLGSIILTTSSSVLYMYGYQKFTSFVESEREKRHILVRETKSSLWSYFPHCSAMCILIALVVCNGPLLYDYTLIYKGSLDGTVLYTVITVISHLFIWILTWLFLTIKQNWKFKLRVTVGRSVVKSARSIKLVNDIDLDSDAENGPMLIVGYGKTFTVNDPEPKKMIMNTLARAAIEKDKNLEIEEGGDGTSTGQAVRTLQRNKQNSNNSSPAKQKVTFDHSHYSTSTLTRSNRRQTEMDIDGVDAEIQTDLVNQGHDSSLSPLLMNQDEPTGSDDIELPPPPGHHHAGLGEESSRMIVSPRPAPRKTQAAVHNNDDVHTPRSNRSVDSGLPHDDVTPRSDSLSTASSSVSPPDQSVSSSSVIPDHRKSTSLDDINIQQQIQQQQGQWKTYSLQRGPHQKEELVNIRPGIMPPPPQPQQAQPCEEGGLEEEEDPYGRCMNMKNMSTFESNNNPRDPRIIDLGFLPQNVPQNSRPGSSAFNTLPVNNNLNNLNSHRGGNGKPPLSSGPNNTLPARPVSACNALRNGPTGRHFKPFDHRKMNPMAGIQENAVYGSIQNPPAPAPSEGTTRNNLIVQKTNNLLPHMPTELRHTNYASTSNGSPLVNPQVLSQRDSANFSVASNEST